MLYDHDQQQWAIAEQSLEENHIVLDIIAIFFNMLSIKKLDAQIVFGASQYRMIECNVTLEWIYVFNGVHFFISVCSSDSYMFQMGGYTLMIYMVTAFHSNHWNSSPNINKNGNTYW